MATICNRIYANHTSLVEWTWKILPAKMKIWLLEKKLFRNKEAVKGSGRQRECSSSQLMEVQIIRSYYGRLSNPIHVGDALV